MRVGNVFLYVIILIQAAMLSYLTIVNREAQQAEPVRNFRVETKHVASNSNSYKFKSDDLNSDFHNNNTMSVGGSSSSSSMQSSQELGLAQVVKMAVDGLVFKREFFGYDMLVASKYCSREVKPLEVTWALQFTIDRVETFQKLLDRWTGPVTAVVYTTSIEGDYLALTRYFSRVDFHFVIGGPYLYPVNPLRNVAISKVRSDFFIVTDVDFIPNINAYEMIMQELPEWSKDLYNVYVLPAFQLFPNRGGNVIPKTKEELLVMYKTKAIDQVHPDPGRAIAHSRTDYVKWTTATEPYAVEYGFPFEPYFVAHKSIPKFDPRFIGYGNDKAVHCKEMNQAGFIFMVWHNGFVVHSDHRAGSWLFKTYQTFDDRLKIVMAGFWADMIRRYSQNPYEPPDPSLNMMLITGTIGDDCDHTCELRGLKCDPGGEKYINHCDALERAFYCIGGCTNSLEGSDLPAFDGVRDRCIAAENRQKFPFLCGASHVDTIRLCPCVENR